MGLMVVLQPLVGLSALHSHPGNPASRSETNGTSRTKKKSGGAARVLCSKEPVVGAGRGLLYYNQLIRSRDHFQPSYWLLTSLIDKLLVDFFMSPLFKSSILASSRQSK